MPGGGYGLASGGSHAPAASLGAGEIEYLRQRQMGFPGQHRQQDECALPCLDPDSLFCHNSQTLC